MDALTHIFATTALAIVSTTPVSEFAVVVDVENSTCRGCVRALKQASRKDSSIDRIKVDRAGNRLILVLEEGVAMDDSAVLKLVSQAGYEVSGIRHP